MKFRKKPIVIEAVQYVVDNIAELKKFAGKDLQVRWLSPTCPNLIIPTLEGDMIANGGDWIIKGMKGEFYPCKSDIFEKTYEKVE